MNLYFPRYIERIMTADIKPCPIAWHVVCFRSVTYIVKLLHNDPSTLSFLTNETNLTNSENTCNTKIDHSGNGLLRLHMALYMINTLQVHHGSLNKKYVPKVMLKKYTVQDCKLPLGNFFFVSGSIWDYLLHIF